MAEKNFNTRIVHKHDIEANWQLAVNFTPKQGELIVYDPDGNFSYPRIKIGDGEKNVNTLPFITDNVEIGEGGEIIYKQTEEPNNAPVGSLWVDLDEYAGGQLFKQPEEPSTATEGDLWVDTDEESGSRNESELVIILEDYQNGWGDPINIVEAINSNRSIRVILDNKTYVYMGYSGNMNEEIIAYFVNYYIDFTNQEVVNNSYLYFDIWWGETFTGEIIIQSQALKRTTSNPAQFDFDNLLPGASPVEGGFLRQRNGKPVWELISNAEEASF